MHEVPGAPGVELDTDRLRVQLSAAGEINERYDASRIRLANAIRPSSETQLIHLTKAEPGGLRARFGAGSA